jgi:peptidoglycan-N-acetylglucosamine deacetylase
MANKPVFFDVTGRRAQRLSTLGWTAAVVSTILFIGFVASLVVAPPCGPRRRAGPFEIRRKAGR